MAEDSISPDHAETKRAKKRAYNKAYGEVHREHLREQARRYYAENAESKKAYQRAYGQAHREERQQYNKEWRGENKAYLAEKNRQWREDNVEHLRAEKQKWKRANRDRLNAKNRAQYAADPQWRARRQRYAQVHAAHRKLMHTRWRKQNRVHINAKVRERRLQKQGTFPCDLSLAQWRELMALCDYQCVYCEQVFPAELLTQDHLTPLSQGGAHTVQNVLPACQSCNSRKHARVVLQPVQPFLLTIARPRKSKVQATRNGQEG